MIDRIAATSTPSGSMLAWIKSLVEVFNLLAASNRSLLQFHSRPTGPRPDKVVMDEIQNQTELIGAT